MCGTHKGCSQCAVACVKKGALTFAGVVHGLNPVTGLIVQSRLLLQQVQCCRPDVMYHIHVRTIGSPPLNPEPSLIHAVCLVTIMYWFLCWPSESLPSVILPTCVEVLAELEQCVWTTTDFHWTAHVHNSFQQS